MLLANILVAEFLEKYCKQKTLLRAHADIPADKKEEMKQFLNIIGLSGEVNLSNSTTLSKSLTALKNKNDDYSQQMFNVLMRKIFSYLQAAKYVTIDSVEGNPEAYSHFGLNFPLYTHFTSPIRRYSDLLVHRLINVALENKDKTLEAL